MSLIKWERPAIRNLGMIATEISDFNKMVYEMFNDPMGSGECSDLIAAHVDRMEAIFSENLKKKFGVTIETAIQEIEKRTSYRWVYFNTHI